jgi:transcriptional regulator with XRE-family HTH domain
MEMVTDKTRLANLSANLRRIMLTRGITQQKLAAMSGVQQTAISRILNVRNNPSISVVSRLAGSLDTSVDKLLEKPEEKNLQHAS